MSNYNSTLQSNNIDLQAILNTINELPEAGGEQATPVISVNTNGLITATAGSKSSTHQLAFQAAKTITPSTTSQIAISSGYYTGGNITVAAIPSQYVVPSGTLTISANGTHDVKNYASAVVNVESSGGNGDGYDEADSLVTMTKTIYTNTRVSSIGTGAFAYATYLRSVNFPNVLSIGSSAFYSCLSLTTISFPAATTIGNCAFSYCKSLTTASFPAVKTIGSNAFYNCNSLTTVSFPAATTIANYTFGYCYKLTSVNFPATTTIVAAAFYACYGLATVSFPAATTIGTTAFAQCSSLTVVSFPAATSIEDRAFMACRKLTTASFPAATTISAGAFISCYKLTSLYLTGSSLCTLSKSTAFSSTPIGGYSTSAGTYGSIYVPASLLTSYKTATNWTYFSSRFVGI